MKLLALNGSPNKEGNTYLALKAVCDEAEACGVETEIVNIGDSDMRGCTGCGACRAGDCAFADERYLELISKLYSADGVVIGSPVYYSGIAGSLKSFLDRAFYQSKGRMRHKMAASVAIPRRSGGMPALEQINNYFLISEMIVVGSYYWNVVHGARPGEILQDGEGMSVLSNLGRNTAWLLKIKDATKETLPPPEKYPRQFTNFIR